MICHNGWNINVWTFGKDFIFIFMWWWILSSVSSSVFGGFHYWCSWRIVIDAITSQHYYYYLVVVVFYSNKPIAAMTAWISLMTATHNWITSNRLINWSLANNYPKTLPYLSISFHTLSYTSPLLSTAWSMSISAHILKDSNVFHKVAIGRTS